MRRLRLFVMILLFVSGINLMGCSRAPQYSLVGKWQMTADNGYRANTIDFTNCSSPHDAE